MVPSGDDWGLPPAPLVAGSQDLICRSCLTNEITRSRPIVLKEMGHHDEYSFREMFGLRRENASVF